MGLTSTELKSNGAIISASNRFQVIVHEVQEHPMIPDYPATDPAGIVHFVHCPNPLQDKDEDNISNVFTELMSMVRYNSF